MNQDHIKPVAGAATFDLEPTEERSLLVEADNGDNQASLRLYRFYDFVKLDRSTALKWLKKSAEDGNAQSQYILGKFYLDDPNVKDVERARYWLQRSARNGYPEAKETIKSL